MLTTWEAAYRGAFGHVFQWRAFIFPAPSGVLDSICDMLGFQTGFSEPLHPGWPRPSEVEPPEHSALHRLLHSPLVDADVVSAIRLFVGFTVSVMLGAILGTAMWRWRTLNDFLGPLFLGMQTLPSVCWVPLAILLFGLNEKGILFVLVMGSAFGISISMRDGMATIPPLYHRAGLMLGARGWRLYRYVMLPASLPALSSSLRTGFSFAWRSLMGAELILIATHHGLGFLLQSAEDTSDVAQVVAVMIVMVTIGMLADRFCFGPLEKKIHHRFGFAPAT